MSVQRQYDKKKTELSSRQRYEYLQDVKPFECGIPTRGSSWLPSHIGYYLFAILFLMFDIETVMLYPWAVVVKQFGPMALVSIGFFLLVLVFGLAYTWRKGALEWK